MYIGEFTLILYIPPTCPLHIIQLRFSAFFAFKNKYKDEAYSHIDMSPSGYEAWAVAK